MAFYKVIPHKDASQTEIEPFEAEQFEVGNHGVTFTKSNSQNLHGTTGQPVRSNVAYFPQVGGIYELTGKELKEAQDKKAEAEKAATDETK